MGSRLLIAESRYENPCFCLSLFAHIFLTSIIRPKIVPDNCFEMFLKLLSLALKFLIGHIFYSFSLESIRSPINLYKSFLKMILFYLILNIWYSYYNIHLMTTMNIFIGHLL